MFGLAINPSKVSSPLINAAVIYSKVIVYNSQRDCVVEYGRFACLNQRKKQTNLCEGVLVMTFTLFVNRLIYRLSESMTCIFIKVRVTDDESEKN